MKVLGVIGSVSGEAVRPLAVLLIGTVFPLSVLSFLWTRQPFSVFDVMEIANAHGQFYHVQILLVPLCITALVEGFLLSFNIDHSIPGRDLTVAVVVTPVVVLLIVMVFMIIHAVLNFPVEHSAISEKDLREGIILFLCCFAVMVVGEIGNAFVRARAKARAAAGLTSSSKPKQKKRNGGPPPGDDTTPQPESPT